MIDQGDIYKGIIIDESLSDKGILAHFNITKTESIQITDGNTPGLIKWTLHYVEISATNAEAFAYKLSELIVSESAWYADFKNPYTHFVIYSNKVFIVDRSKENQYLAAIKYGKKLGIPEHQLDFDEG